MYTFVHYFLNKLLCPEKSVPLGNTVGYFSAGSARYPVIILKNAMQINDI